MISNHMYLLPLNDKVTVIKQINKNPDIDEWGVAEYESTSKEYKCHISYNYKLEPVTIGEGNNIVYTAKIYFRGLVNLDGKDKIGFSDMNGAYVEKEILTVYPVRDFGGKVLATCLIVEGGEQCYAD